MSIDQKLIDRINVLARKKKEEGLTEEEAKTHPRRNHITRAIGTDEMVVVDIFNKKISENDVVLLASDGLTGCVYEEDIKNIFFAPEVSIRGTELEQCAGTYNSQTYFCSLPEKSYAPYVLDFELILSITAFNCFCKTILSE